jgi:hypothetical protein
MKKMNKMYEAPMAEMIEMQLPVVLLESANVGGGTMSGGSEPPTTDPSYDDPTDNG